MAPPHLAPKNYPALLETIAINFAYALYVGSGFVKTILRLRIGLVGVSMAFVFWAAMSGVWPAVFWNLAFGGVHGYQLFRLWTQHRSISLNQDERALHKRLFPDLSLVDFFTLWSIGTARAVPTGEVLIRERTVQQTLILIVSGVVTVERSGEFVATLGSDAMVGERSYLTGDLANATVSASSDSIIHEWNQQKMAVLTGLCPDAHDSLLRYIGLDLATKLN